MIVRTSHTSLGQIYDLQIKKQRSQIVDLTSLSSFQSVDGGNLTARMLKPTTSALCSLAGVGLFSHQ
jgi:hypothetical protein